LAFLVQNDPEKAYYIFLEEPKRTPTLFTLQKCGVACPFEEIRHVLIIQWLFILYTFTIRISYKKTL
jgi:hypothetical protein